MHGMNPFQKFKGTAVEVQECIRNFISHLLDVVLKLIHVMLMLSASIDLERLRFLQMAIAICWRYKLSYENLLQQ